MNGVRIGRVELRAGRNYCGGFGHLVHYSGRMHTWHLGPFFFGFRIWSDRAGAQS